MKLATMHYPDGSEITGQYVYRTDDGWVGVRLPGETRIDEYPEECVTTFDVTWDECIGFGEVIDEEIDYEGNAQ